MDDLITVYNNILNTFPITTKQDEVEMYVVLLNTILVLTHARPAYILDIKNQQLANALLSELLDYFPDLMTMGDHEKLLFLMENEELVAEHQATPLGRAQLLGYCYQGYDFMDVTIDRWSIKPTAINEHFNIGLYITVIPDHAYNGAIKECVDDQVALFDSILAPFGFRVVLTERLNKGRPGGGNVWYDTYRNK